MVHRFPSFVCLMRRLTTRAKLLCVPALIGLLMVGCAETTSSEGVLAPSTPTTSAVPALPPNPAVAQAPVSQPPVEQPINAPASSEQPAQEEVQDPGDSPKKSEEAKPRKILGKTTRDVRDAQKEVAAGAKTVQPKITGQDPITISGNAYTVIVSRAEQLQIKHSLDIFYTINGHYPKNLQEFMKEIIKANGIRLAQLPYYQEYGYDAVTHELVILEYPDKRAAYEGRGR